MTGKDRLQAWEELLGCWSARPTPRWARCWRSCRPTGLGLRRRTARSPQGTPRAGSLPQRRPDGSRASGAIDEARDPARGSTRPARHCSGSPPRLLAGRPKALTKAVGGPRGPRGPTHPPRGACSRELHHHDRRRDGPDPVGAERWPGSMTSAGKRYGPRRHCSLPLTTTAPPWAGRLVEAITRNSRSTRESGPGPQGACSRHSPATTQPPPAGRGEGGRRELDRPRRTGPEPAKHS